MQAGYPPNDRYYAQQQPAYGGQPPYFQQFPGYGYPQSAPQAIAQPFPMYPPHYDQLPPSTPHMQTGRPRPLARESSRASTPGGGGRPLKSAMKMKRTKTPERGASVGSVPLPRGRSESLHRQRTRSGSRRANSVPRFVPGAP